MSFDTECDVEIMEFAKKKNCSFGRSITNARSIVGYSSPNFFLGGGDRRTSSFAPIGLRLLPPP